MKLLTIAQVAQAAKHPVSTIHYWRKAGVLQFERVGSVYLTTQDELNRFMSQRKEEGK